MILIGLFYGSTDGATAAVARRIAELCAEAGWAAVELLDVAEYDLAEMESFDVLLLGIPTWNVGQMQRDWEAAFPEIAALDLAGKRVALFGLGDQAGYPDTFADALIFFADALEERGATLVGRWPTDGYDFRNSWAVQEGRFVGLVLDEINQPELTEGRLRAWLEQVRREIVLY
jgi:flavodoxin I